MSATGPGVSERYIRFVVDGRDPDSGRRQGLFQAGEALATSDRMAAADALLIAET